jgi:hypothetical protein
MADQPSEAFAAGSEALSGQPALLGLSEHSFYFIK